MQKRSLVRKPALNHADNREHPPLENTYIGHLHQYNLIYMPLIEPKRLFFTT